MTVLRLGFSPDLSHIRFEGAPVRSGVVGKPASRAPLPEEPPPRPLLSWILRAGGATPEAYLPSALGRRLAACLRGAQASSEDEARARLLRDPGRLEGMLDILLIGVTEFFRDPAVFEALESRGLPELLASRGRVRALSAGCSDGRELYSLALSLASRGALDRAELVGVDVRRSALRLAAEGRFPLPKDVDPRRFEAGFTREGDTLVARPELRARCRWRAANLLGLDLEGSYDLILFRNVAIYLRPAAALPLWTSFAASLSPGGLLVTGKAEAPPPELRLRRIGPCLYRREAA